MINPIVEENLISFKVLEYKIYAYVCELGKEITQITLEPYGKELVEGRDKKVYCGIFNRKDCDHHQRRTRRTQQREMRL